MSLASIYITAPSRDEAVRLSRALLEQRLIACANILENATSLYWWQGGIETASECVIIAKTQMRLVHRVTQVAAELHPYEVPCITATPILKCNRAYADWVEAETAAAADQDVF